MKRPGIENVELEHLLQIADGVENCDHVKERGDETDDHLSSNCKRYVASWIGDFFREVRNAIGSSNGEGSVEHTGQKDDAVTSIASSISPMSPDER